MKLLGVILLVPMVCAVLLAGLVLWACNILADHDLDGDDQ